MTLFFPYLGNGSQIKMQMDTQDLQKLKEEIQLQAKNGLDFILAAGILWLVISYLWTLDYSAYNKSIFTFIVGAFLLPLAFGLSKVLKTNWKIRGNPLQPLGLWLNFAQLIYFPFLIFILIKYPDYFIMSYAIITGAHLFPYAWFYDEMGYAVVAIVISLGSMGIALYAGPQTMWYVPLFTSIFLFLLALWIYVRWQRFKSKVAL
jgi:hypothetical protein